MRKTAQPAYVPLRLSAVLAIQPLPVSHAEGLFLADSTTSLNILVVPTILTSAFATGISFLCSTHE